MKSHLIIMLVLLIAIAGCGETPVAEEPVAPVEEIIEEPAVEEVPVMLTASVDILRKAFMPEELRVKLGTTVTWVNKDTIGHTVSFRGSTGYTQYSGIVPSGKTMEVVFNDVGEFPYINGALGIQGTIIVEE